LSLTVKKTLYSYRSPGGLPIPDPKYLRGYKYTLSRSYVRNYVRIICQAQGDHSKYIQHFFQTPHSCVNYLRSPHISQIISFPVHPIISPLQSLHYPISELSPNIRNGLPCLPPFRTNGTRKFSRRSRRSRRKTSLFQKVEPTLSPCLLAKSCQISLNQHKIPFNHHSITIKSH
jgi:hypothetical protein